MKTISGVAVVLAAMGWSAAAEAQYRPPVQPSTRLLAPPPSRLAPVQAKPGIAGNAINVQQLRTTQGGSLVAAGGLNRGGGGAGLVAAGGLNRGGQSGLVAAGGLNRGGNGAGLVAAGGLNRGGGAGFR